MVSYISTADAACFNRTTNYKTLARVGTFSPQQGLTKFSFVKNIELIIKVSPDAKVTNTFTIGIDQFGNPGHLDKMMRQVKDYAQGKFHNTL